MCKCNVFILICVYVRNTVNFKICLCFSNSVCELLILKLQNPSIIIIIIYRPPSCLDCYFIDVISRAEQYIFTIPAPLSNIILLGDFNFPLINWSNPNSHCVSPNNSQTLSSMQQTIQTDTLTDQHKNTRT